MTKVTQKGWAMSLGSFSGIGFLLSDGVEVKFAQSGSAWARLPLVFKKDKKDANGNWSADKQLKVDATVFGPLAEFLSQEVQGRQDIAVSGELYTEEYTTKDGETKTALRLNVFSASPVGKPRERAASAPASSGFADDGVPF